MQAKAYQDYKKNYNIYILLKEYFKRIKMTEIGIETYLDDFELFEKVCKQRKLRVYPNKQEYIAKLSQIDILSLWHTYCLIQNKEKK